MRTLRMTRMLYNEFVYPAAAANTDSNAAELRLTIKVLDALEAIGIPPELDPNTGLPQKGQPFFTMKEHNAEIQLEDQLAEHLAKKLEASIKSLQSWRARHLLPLIDQLRKEGS